MADLREYETEQQHVLARHLTIIMSMGVGASILVGWLMDSVGLETSTVVTLVLGQIHLLILVLLSDHTFWMVVGFVFYTLFRQFLFPVYIASLTTRLGFKYFGLLNGIGFALSGIAQLFMARLVKFVQGDCHELSMSEETDCETGHWHSLHMLSYLILGTLIISPILEYLQKTSHEKRARRWWTLGAGTKLADVSRHSRASTSTTYGALQSIAEDEPLGLTIEV